MDSRQFDELVARLALASNRRDALKGVAGGALGSVIGVTSVASAENKNKDKKGRKTSAEHKRHGRKCKNKPKQTICHKGRTITVSQCAVNKHLNRHGDTLGPCPYGG